MSQDAEGDYRDSTSAKMRKRSMDQPLILSDLRIVLLGKTGAGKSSSGNTILGEDREIFKVGFLPESHTAICQQAQTEVDGHKIYVIDTVELFDPTKKETGTLTKIEQIFDCARDGVDVCLLLIKLGEKNTDEDQNPVMWIQEIFGAKVLKHTIVLFTHGDLIDVPVEKCLREYKTLRSAVDQCSGGYHVFNNKNEARSQVNELLKKIETLRMMNGDKYTKQDYERNQKELLDEQRRNREAAEEKARLLEEAERQARLLKEAAEEKARLEEAVKEQESLLKEVLVGAVVGGAAAGLAIAAKMGAAASNAVKAVAGVFAGAAAVGSGVYYFRRKPRNNR